MKAPESRPKPSVPYAMKPMFCSAQNGSTADSIRRSNILYPTWLAARWPYRSHSAIISGVKLETPYCLILPSAFSLLRADIVSSKGVS